MHCIVLAMLWLYLYSFRKHVYTESHKIDFDFSICMNVEIREMFTVSITGITRECTAKLFIILARLEI